VNIAAVVSEAGWKHWGALLAFSLSIGPVVRAWMSLTWLKAAKAAAS
jgi:hypothetical protein